MKALVVMPTASAANNWIIGTVRYGLRALEGFLSQDRIDITIVAPEEHHIFLQDRFPSIPILIYKSLYRHTETLRKLHLPKIQRLVEGGRCSRLIQKTRADVVFIPYLWDEYFIRCKNKPMVLTVHDLVAYHARPFYRFFVCKRTLPLQLKRASKIIAITQIVRDDIFHSFPDLPSEKVHVIQNGIPVPSYTLSPICIVGKFILAVNRLEPHKNYITLLRAFKLVAELIPHRMVIVGNKTPYWETVLWPYIVESGLKDRISLLSSIEDNILFNLYVKADLFVTTSMKEGFGFTPIEAAMLGAKVISSREPALLESTMGLVNYYDPPLDALALSKRIMEVLSKDDAEERERIAETFRIKYDCKAKASEISSLLIEASSKG